VVVVTERKSALTVVTTALLLALALSFFVLFVQADARPPAPECTGVSQRVAAIADPNASTSSSPAMNPTGRSTAGIPEDGANGAMCKLPTE
jgi:hypothetical protein